MFRIFGVPCGNLPDYSKIPLILVKIPSQYISPLFVYLHKLESVVDDGGIIISIVSDDNKCKNYTLSSKYN